MNWWQKFLAWLGVSKPGGRREQVETWLENNRPRLQQFLARQQSRRQAKGHFFQRLRGWAKPSDNDDDPENDFLGQLPAWADISVDVWESPTGKGWTLKFWVTEADNTVWVLSYDSEAGLLGWGEQKPLVQ